MIDWYWVATSSLWITGLALILAAASLADCARRVRRRALRRAWWSLFDSDRARGGTLLVCAGMALARGFWLERVLWTLVGADTLYRWWRLRRAEADEAAGPPTGSGFRRRWHFPRRAVEAATWYVEAAPVWLVVTAPLFLFPTPERATVLLLLPALAIARRIAGRGFFPRTPLDWPLAVLAVMVPVSLYATFDVPFSLGKIVGLLYGLGWYQALVGWADSRRRLASAVAGVTAAGTAVASVALVGTNWGNKLPGLAALARHLPRRLLQLPGAEDGFQPNQIGGTLLWVVPLLLALAAWSWTAPAGTARRWALRVGILVPLGITGGTLVLTQSRSALVGLLAGCALLGLLAATLTRWARWAVLAGIVTLGGAAVLIGPGTIAHRLTSGQDAGATAGLNSLNGRLEIWSRALYGLQDFPLTGMGMNNFRRLAPLLYPFFSLPPTTDIAHAHNQLLQAGLDLGVPGLVAYLALWFGAATLVAQAWRHARGWERALTAGIGASLLASFIFGLTDAIALGAKPGVLFWALLALLVASWRRAIAPGAAHGATGRARPPAGGPPADPRTQVLPPGTTTNGIATASRSQGPRLHAHPYAYRVTDGGVRSTLPPPEGAGFLPRLAARPAERPTGQPPA